jgi:predicted peroxiredoxin
MFILLVISDNSLRNIEDFKGLTDTFFARDYKVAAFFTGPSVNMLKADQEELKSLPAGIKMYACRTVSRDLGLTKQEDLIHGAKMSSLGELVELIEEADRCIFLGGHN